MFRLTVTCSEDGLPVQWELPVDYPTRDAAEAGAKFIADAADIFPPGEHGEEIQFLGYTIQEFHQC